MILGPFWLILRVRDVTKGVQILTSWISAFIIGFPTPKDLPMSIFRSNQSFYRVLLRFRWFWDHFGSFWGSVTSQKGSRFCKFEFQISSLVFPPQNTYPCTFLDQTNHFIEYFCVLSDFGTILAHFRGSVASPQGSRLWKFEFLTSSYVFPSHNTYP